jgi:hypothetical protein
VKYIYLIVNWLILLLAPFWILPAFARLIWGDVQEYRAAKKAGKTTFRNGGVESFFLGEKWVWK